MKETIAEMLKVEARAREIVAEAEAEAAEVVRRAGAEAAAIEEAGRRAAQAKAAKMFEEGIAEVQKRRDAQLAQIDERTARLRHVAPDKADAARKRILAALTGQ